MPKAALAVILLLNALPLFAKSKPVSIPFVISSDMVVVPATVNGTIPIHVILDTGAGLDILAPSLIEKLHGKPAGQFSGFRMTGERLDIALFVIPELAVGPIDKKNQMVGSFDALDQLHIDGIVSLNDFRQNPFTLDFISQVIVFETSKSLAERLAKGKFSPLQLDDQRGIALDVFAQFLIAGQPGQCEIDTGSQNATVSLQYMALIGIEKDAKNVQKQEKRTIAGGMEVRYKTQLPEISLAALPEIGLTHPGVSFSNIIYDCVVGTDFWAGKALTIDIAGRRLIVSNPPQTH